MGVAVEDREAADQHRRDPERRPRRQRHHQAEHDRRHRDADLDAGKRNAENAENAAERHHQREHDRQQPDRRGTQEAPHSPTATIAITWSGPKIGCAKPPVKPPENPSPPCAKAGQAASTAASTKNACRINLERSIASI